VVWRSKRRSERVSGDVTNSFTMDDILIESDDGRPEQLHHLKIQCPISAFRERLTGRGLVRHKMVRQAIVFVINNVRKILTKFCKRERRAGAR